MNFSEDLVIAILDYIRQHSNYGGIVLHFNQVPGEHSNQEIAFHLEDSRNRGYVEARISGDKIMAEVSLTPAGLRYLQSQT